MLWMKVASALKGLTNSFIYCALVNEDSLTRVLWTDDTFENKLSINCKLEKYLMENW